MKPIEVMLICTEKRLGDQDGSCSIKMKHVVEGKNDSADEELFKYGDGAVFDMGVVRAEAAQGISEGGVYLCTITPYTGKSEERQKKDREAEQKRKDEVNEQNKQREDEKLRLAESKNAAGTEAAKTQLKQNDPTATPQARAEAAGRDEVSPRDSKTPLPTQAGTSKAGEKDRVGEKP